MIFKKERSLKDKVFGTKIVFVDYGERDSIGGVSKTEKELEAQLIDDFGAPEVELGGEFVGYVKLSGKDLSVSIDDSKASDHDKITFVLSSSKAIVKEGFEAPLLVDAKKTPAHKDTHATLTQEQTAEVRCKIFEDIIVDRLCRAVDSLKAKLTTFETEDIDEVIIPLKNHNHK